MLESRFQARLIKRLHEEFQGCVILKNDSGYKQGVPDLIILFQDRWAMLEVKASSAASLQANQAYYIDKLGQMSFAAFIYPENEEEVLHELHLAFSSRRKARVSQP